MSPLGNMYMYSGNNKVFLLEQCAYLFHRDRSIHIERACSRACTNVY